MKIRIRISFYFYFQTSTMIKATARSAPDREREINNLIRKADFNNDPFVQEFGLNISHNLMEV